MRKKTIDPIAVASRLELLALPTQDRPWIEEVMWYLQAISPRGDGCRLLAKALVEQFPDNLITASYRKKAKLTKTEANQFWASVPLVDQARFKEIVPFAFAVEMHELLFSGDEDWRADERKKGLPELDAKAVCEVVKAIAEDGIAERLHKLISSESETVRFDCWVFKNVPEALRAYLAANAEKGRERIAKTSVVEKVFDALNFAWEEGVMVQIEGDPRHGKTEAIATYCEMYPGRARLVTIPSESTDAEFFKEVAEALGIEVGGPSCNLRELRGRIDYVLKRSRLLLIFDEFHFAIPQKYSATTAPIRMNWIRTRVADRGLPTALLITPQSFDEAFRKFARKTRHRFDQFFGRTARFTLPSALSRSDVIAVAEIHFPEIDRDYLGLIAGRAMQCQPGNDPAGRIQPGFLHGVEVTARRARYFARHAGREEITEDDVYRAMDEQMPADPVAPKKKRPQKRLLAKATETRRESRRKNWRLS